ncbi:transporter substrate-binding domain-containing protein [Enterococcus dongliensis]|uniref:Transporter substrate-binding domain-containing protein n=1 Tax=Enterococcus dongliensis TaxID=2559925 RepID=A0AAW8TJ07_9ENTE|nr:transporter substrate-binding domain-containing protein [Enterococcus dongliensis]MDT2604040.1 transporter substrate-binding domain-containing protein [Enterococcus dongliensis]MDT2635609.1 transporter substrate-binding domain-containing protein [Enterococcus dongliensis]MDT2638291.1 transporter substrate-binding domain-containing protein [Enterococcus dongliensis]MDT2643415.1 transporter substrate-binding domain-containing protein [Enterococcus dongliensis]MDT2645158.1 transporter substrat
MKKWLAVISGLLLIGLVLTGCGNSADSKDSKSKETSALQEIKDRGKLKVAVFGDLSPYGYVDGEGKHQGYDIYLAKRLAKDLLGSEDKIEYVTVNAEERVDALKSNKVDVVLANFTKTPDREKVVDFADPYMKVAIGVVSPKNTAITKVKDLDGKRLIVTKGTTAETYFTKEHPDVNLEKYESKSQQFQALIDGRAEALADDNSYLYAWVKENPDFEVGIKEVGEVSTINPAVKKGNKELLNWVNDELKTLSAEGFFEKAYEETLAPFFGADIEAKDIIVTND